MEISWQAVVARRMRRHYLTEPAVSPVDAVRAMCGAHAQVLTAGETSVALRVEGATRETVQNDEGLVKTFGPRGTVHLLPLEDLPMWTGALSALLGGPPPPEAMRMTADQKAEVIAAIGEALSDAELTVDELSDEVVRRTGPWAGDLVMPAFQTWWPRWRQVIPDAANAGVLCYGANRGRVTTYTTPQRRGAFAPMDPERALPALLHSYLYAYGPATPQQFARWIKSTVTVVRPYFEGLPETEFGFVAPGDEEFTDEPVEGVHLLPYFDAYGVGCFPRELVFPGKALERATNRGQAGNYPLLLIDGSVAGVWHQKKSGRNLQVTVEPLVRLNRRQQAALAAAVDRVATIQSTKGTLTVGEITVGPHA
ncbi:winged helix DNA-binding domain-containing protein [Kribbella sp. NPDC056951]|uniref:winged helix DNA-binding domain-containing protein n=1 Tax=Kribbella sp. NPDC056951 TaxID=3345978 RepID=UPI0036271ABD